MCSLVVPCHPEQAELSTANYLGQRPWNTPCFGLQPPVTYCIAAWCFHTTSACQEQGLIWAAGPNIQSVLKCAQVLRGEIKKAKPNQPQPRYHQPHVSTWQEKLIEAILTILKHYGDNTHRQEEMAQQRLSEVPTGVQSWDHVGPCLDHAHLMTILTSQWLISLISCLSPISNKHHTFTLQ